MKHLNILQTFYKDKDCLVETNVGPNGIKVTIAGKHPGKLSLFVLTLMRYR